MRIHLLGAENAMKYQKIAFTLAFGHRFFGTEVKSHYRHDVGCCTRQKKYLHGAILFTSVLMYLVFGMVTGHVRI